MSFALNSVSFGDCRAILPSMPRGIARMCVTSPPYYGLRDYGVQGQLGLESTLDEYVHNLVEVFRCVRNVLSKDGTLWLNLGDSYANNGGATHAHRNTSGGYEGSDGKRNQGYAMAGGGFNRPRTTGSGLKTKDLIGIPWKVAFALQADGWYLRQDIIWHKPNAMPESVRDRCTKAHEYLFLLSKADRYFFNHTLIKDDAKWERWGDQTVKKAQPGTAKWIGSRSKQELQALGKKNKRSVWTIPTKPFQGAHFAAFPPDLIRPCILAGSEAGDTILDPFMGTGTTAAVALALGRTYLGCELNKEYRQFQKTRLDGVRKQADLFAATGS